MNQFLEMTSRFTVGIGDDVNFVSSPHRYCDIVETEPGESDFENYLRWIISIDREFRSLRFRSMIEEFDIALSFENFTSLITFEFLPIIFRIHLTLLIPLSIPTT